VIRHRIEEDLEFLCGVFEEQLKRLTLQRGRGRLSEAQFIDKLLEMEAEEITPRGLTLTASNTIDDWTVFKIKNNQTHQTCAVVECLPETGDLRPAGAAERR
jgi:hypothetical protein